MNDTDSKRRQLIHVAILSAIGLAVELLLIRWLDSQVRALSYVKNLTLIASFLGLGIGYASVGRKPRFVPFAVILISLLIGLGTFLASEAGDRLQAGPATTEANLGVRVATSSMEVATFCAVIAIVFFAVTIALVPLGQLTGEYLVGLEPVQSYTANIFGSLAGVLLVFAVSSLSVPPWITMTFCVIVTLGYIWRRNRFAILSALTALIALAGMAALDHQPERITVWSPYNRIEATKLPVEAGANAPHGWMLRVQNLFYQQIIDLSPQMTSRYGHLKNIQKAAYEYNFPYVWKRPPGEVLVLGAGTGNDVAAALRAGATRVDAVEIDPRIVDLGRELHGEKPYSDPRVHVIVTDARAYMKSTPRR